MLNYGRALQLSETGLDIDTNGYQLKLGSAALKAFGAGRAEYYATYDFGGASSERPKLFRSVRDSCNSPLRRNSQPLIPQCGTFTRELEQLHPDNRHIKDNPVNNTGQEFASSFRNCATSVCCCTSSVFSRIAGFDATRARGLAAAVKRISENR